MLTIISKFYLWLIGWKVAGRKPEVKKYVLIAAPHTSNFDFPITIAVCTLLGLDFKFLAKKQLFRFPLGILMRFFGGIPVDRNRKGNMVEYSIEMLRNTPELGLLIPAEGTRGYVKDFKTGFYYTALGAGVPIVMGFLDYGRKQGGVMDELFYPTGNYEADILKIRACFKGILPRHPERTSLNEN